MKNGQKKQLIVPEYLTVELAALYMSMSERTVRYLLTDPVDPIPHFKKGRMIRIRQSELIDWFEKYRAVNHLDIADIVKDILK